MRRKLVISAVNFTEGGPLKILQDAVNSAMQELPEWDILVIVNRPGLLNCEGVREIVCGLPKRSWIHRLWFEWVSFFFLSLKLKPDVWLSLHDITPNVSARRRATYCHNSSPFYNISIREAFLEPTLFLFCTLYRYVYQINIMRNEYIIVQQGWLRDAFTRLFRHNNIIVAHPIPDIPPQNTSREISETTAVIFLYPAFPRVFKNFEVICEAYNALPEKIKRRTELRLTITGNENRYARELYKRYGASPGIVFLGRLERTEMMNQYALCDAVLFPSKLESWGLPISEAKAYGLPLLVADLPYAKETVGEYSAVSFLPPGDSSKWGDAMAALANGSITYQGNHAANHLPPYAKDWKETWKLLTDGL